MIKLKTEEALKNKAREIRIEVVKMINKAGSGHPAGSLGATDILVALYYNILNHDPKKPDWKQRDRFILSNGHVCPALYAVLADCGYFPKSCLSRLRRLGSPLQGHPERIKVKGMETTSGPLGSGYAQAVGMALAAKIDDLRHRIYTLTSDAEQNCGNHWEAVMASSKYKLSNLTLIIDRNGIQIGGDTEDIMPIEPLAEKYRAFGFKVIEIDGHDFRAIFSAFSEARSEYDRPSVIIAKTIPGKGVSFMEEQYLWHGRAITDSELRKAIKDLEE